MSENESLPNFGNAVDSYCQSNGTAIATVNLVQKNPCAECEARQQESMRKLARRSVERRGAAMMDAILGVSE